jgi:hypothetical protein
MSVCLKKGSKTRGEPLPEEEAAMRRLNNRSGVSIIAVVFLIVVVAFLGVIVVSLFTTQSAQSVGELNSTQALFIADGGIEYIFKNRTFPDYSMLGSTVTLGGGTFTVDSPAYTTVLVPAGAGVTITVNWTGWFTTYPTAGGGNVGIVLSGPSEEIACTGMTATTFTGCNKLGGGALTGGQVVNTEVYPVTRLNGALTPGACPITVDSTRGFLPQGVIKIDNEYIHYTGTTATTFTGCTRGFKGTSDVGHGNMKSVYQYVITSTGSVSTIFGGTAQRVVRVTLTQ